MLEKYKHRVTLARDGVEALQILERQTFDLVLMDVQMPEMDGVAATAAIRAKEHPGGTRLPIVAMTACALKGDEARFLKAGMDAYIGKPIHLPELFRAIEAARSNSRQPPLPESSPAPE
jgi:CheY-like chemotaxis protein